MSIVTFAEVEKSLDELREDPNFPDEDSAAAFAAENEWAFEFAARVREAGNAYGPRALDKLNYFMTRQHVSPP